MNWKRNLRIVWFANVVTAAGLFAMVPFFTYYVETLGLPDEASRHRWAGLLVGAAPVVAALMGPFWGGLGDRIGRRPMVLRALISITVFVGLMTFCRSPWTMLLLRILQGAFSGYTPPSMTLVSVQAPPERQNYVAGSVSSAVHAGAVIGYFMGGQLAEHSIRMIFPVCAGLSLLGFVAVLFVEEAPTEKSDAEIASPTTMIQKIVADYRYVFGLKPLLKLLSGLILVRCALSTADPNFARFVEKLGGGETEAGLVMSLQSLMLLLAMPLWGRFSDRRSPTITLAISSIGAALAFLGQANATSVTEIFLLRAATGVFLAGIFPAAYGLAAKTTPNDRRGSANGVVFMCLAMAHAVGSLIGGELLNRLGFRPLLATIAGTSFLLFLTTLRTMVATRRNLARATTIEPRTPPTPRQPCP